MADDDSPAEVGRWFENAVLVYGPRKAGTTLLQNLLDGTPDLLVYPAELKLKQLIFLGAAQRAARYQQISRIPVARPAGLDLPRYQQLLAGLARHGERMGLKELIRADVGFLQAVAGTELPATPQSWAAKEVGGRTEAIVRWWLASFAQPRIVFIVRDPAMVTRAVLRERRRSGKRQTLRDLVYETMDPRRVLHAQVSLLGDPRILAVAYEDLVDDPPRAMARVATFLGVPYRDQFSRPTVLGRPVVVRTASRDSTEVFKDDADWRQGLSWRERVVVGVTAWLAQRWRGTRVDYSALRRTLR